MSLPTDRNILEELWTGEVFEPEPDEEMDLRCSGSFAESQARLARALDRITEMLKDKPC